jgi:hypothetical protein
VVADDDRVFAVSAGDFRKSPGRHIGIGCGRAGSGLRSFG